MKNIERKEVLLRLIQGFGCSADESCKECVFSEIGDACDDVQLENFLLNEYVPPKNSLESLGWHKSKEFDNCYQLIYKVLEVENLEKPTSVFGLKQLEDYLNDGFEMQGSYPCGDGLIFILSVNKEEKN